MSDVNMDSDQLCSFLCQLPRQFGYRYSDQVQNVLHQRLFTSCYRDNPSYARYLFPDGPPLEHPDIPWSLQKAQGAVEGAEYTEAARGQACGHVLRPGEASYQCRTCQADPTCVLCARCFDASDHEGHPVYINASDGNSGCCDCGDPEAWNRPVHCGIHSEHVGGSSSKDKQRETQVPQELINSIRMTIARCLDYMCDVWSCSPEQLRANKSEKSVRDDELFSTLSANVYQGPDPAAEEGKDTEYALVLWNDEKHTIQDVRDIVMRACRVRETVGMEKAEEIDQVGRSVVKYSTDLSVLLRAAEILEQPKLSVTIRASRDIFRESMCGSIIEWIQDISGCFVGEDGKLLKNIICEELIQEWRIGSKAHHKIVGQDGIYDHDKEEVAKDLQESLGPYSTEVIRRLNDAWGTPADQDDQTDDADDEASDGQQTERDAMDVDEPPTSQDFSRLQDMVGDVVLPDGETGRTAADQLEPIANQAQSDVEMLAVPRTPAAKLSKAPRPPKYWRDLPAEAERITGSGLADNLRARVRLDWLILYDLRMWKNLRKAMREVLITTMITVTRFKRILALRFASVFTVLAELHLIADREPDYSLIYLSLQLLTTPSITSEAMDKGNFLTNLMAIIYTFLTTRQVAYPHQVDLSATLAIEQGVVFNRRAHTFYSDMSHMLALDVVRARIRAEPRYLLQFLDIAKINQGICPTVRATGEHVEYEMEAWMSLSTVMIEIMKLCKLIAESFRVEEEEHEQCLETAIRATAGVTIISSLGCEIWRFDQSEIKNKIRFQTLEPFEFEQPHNQVSYLIVQYDVGKEPMSCYHPLHYVLSWLLNEARAAPAENVRTLLSFRSDDLCNMTVSKQTIIDLQRVGQHNQLYLLALFDYPMRVCAWMAQTRAGMWVRNGLSLRHQIQQYKSVSRRDLTYQRDLFLVQTAFVVCDPATALATLVDRFDLLDLIRGKFDVNTSRDEKQTVEVTEEFVHLLIIILCDRLNLVPESQEKVAEMAIRRELVQALCGKPMTYTELKKHVSEKAKHADDQGILQEMATFKAPEGMTDHGTFTLKEQYMEDIDPYLPFLSRNQREESELVWRKHMAKTTGKELDDIVYEPKLMPIEHGLYKDIHLFTKTPLFAQVIFYLIQYVMMAPTVAPKVEATQIEQLFQFVLHLTLVAIDLDDPTSAGASSSWDVDMDDMATEREGSPYLSFSKMTLEKKATKVVSADTIAGLLQRSMALEHLKSCAPRVKCIFRHLQQKQPNEYRAWAASVQLTPDVTDESRQSSAEVDAAAKDLKKKQALERQAKIMAQMKQQQNSFLKNQTIDWGEDLDAMDDLEDDDMTITAHEKVVNFPSGSCIMCQEDLDDTKLFGTFGFLAESNVFRTTPLDEEEWVREVFETPENLDRATESRPFGVASKNRQTVEKVNSEGKIVQSERQGLATGFPSGSTIGGPVSTGCGHVMHYTCFENYASTTARRHSVQIARHHAENISRHEFLCPLCKALGNTFLPIVWKSRPLAYPGILSESRNVEEFLQNQIGQEVLLQHSQAEALLKSYAETTFVAPLAAQIQPTLDGIEAQTSMPQIPGFQFIETEPPEMLNLIEIAGRSPTLAPQTPAILEPRRSTGQLNVEELRAVYDLLSSTLVLKNLDYFKHDHFNSSGEFGTLISSVAGSITALEIAQRGVESEEGSTLLDKISSQSITHLRILSESVLSYLTLSLLTKAQNKSAKMELFSRHQRLVKTIFIPECAPCPTSYPDDCDHDKYPALLAQDPFISLSELTFFIPTSQVKDVKPFMKLLYLAEIMRVVVRFEAYQGLESLSPLEDVPDNFSSFVDAVDESWIMNLRDNKPALYALAKKYALPFLRKCIILMHIRYGIDFPPTTTDANELDRLSALLFLPNFDDLVSEAVSSPLLRRQLNHWVEHLGPPEGVQLTHPAIFELIGLPKNFDTLQDEVMRRKCPTTGRALWDPAICFFCGEIFCSQSVCCTRAEDEEGTGLERRRMVGGCWQHRAKCGGRVGIFLHIRKCVILYLHEESGSFMVAPYLDKFGETDPSLRTSMQLFLNQKRYDNILRAAWLNHQIPSIIARKLEGEMSTGGWESL